MLMLTLKWKCVNIKRIFSVGLLNLDLNNSTPLLAILLQVSGVNFINIIPVILSYEHHFSSFFLVSCTWKNDVRMKNLYVKCWWNWRQVVFSRTVSALSQIDLCQIIIFRSVLTTFEVNITFLDFGLTLAKNSLYPGLNLIKI